MSDYLPLAIQEEIMKRLPTKAVMQFRSVSKAWKSLIDSSKFVVDYSFYHTHPQHLLLSYTCLQENYRQKYVSIVDDETFPEHKYSCDPIAEPGVSKIIGTSQGLFCIYSDRGEDPHDHSGGQTAVLWNPSIKKSVAIPDVPDDLLLGDQENYIIIGFGVCPHTIDPKLVKINISRSLSNLESTIITFNPWQVEIYTLSSGAWTSIPTINQPRNSIELMMWGQVVIDGCIYWLAKDCISVDMMSIEIEFDGYLIVSFDLTSDEFMEVSLPDTLAHASDFSLNISKLKETLIVVETVEFKQVYAVWKMELRGFTKLFTINSPDASIQYILGFRKTDQPIFNLFKADDDAHEVVVDQLHSQHINYVGISGNGRFRSVDSYMETLLLLNH